LTPDELNHVLEQLRMLAADADAEGDLERWYEFQEAIDRLQDWRDDGMAGDCPVDLADYDLVLKGGAAEQESALGAWTQPVRSAGQKLESGDLRDAITELTALLSDPELPVEVRRQARHLLGQAQQGKARRIDELMERASALEEAHDWDGAQQAYDEVLDLAPRHRDALRRVDPLPMKRRAEQARALLRQENDVQALDEGVTNARQLLSEGLVDAELQSLAERAEGRRDELRALAGEITTQLALGDLENVYQAVLRVRHRLDQGERTFPKDKGYVPIDEYYAEVMQEWKTASNNLAERVLKRVQDDLSKSPSEAERKLVDALGKSLCEEGKSVSDARERIAEMLGFKPSESDVKSILHEDVKKDLQNRLTDVQRAVARRNEAVQLIQEALDAPKLGTAWELLATARELNPDVEDVNRRIERQQHGLTARLASKVREKAASAESHLLNHAFEKGRKCCFEGLELLGTFGDPDEALANEGALVHDLVKRINEEEERQHSIGQWDVRIREALRKGDVAIAVKLHDEIATGLRSDPRVKELTLLMANHQELERVQADARRAFDDRDWAHAVDLCDTIINRGGPLAEWAKELRLQGRTEILLTQVDGQSEQGYYQQAKRTLQELQKVNPQSADRCQPYVDEIDELSKNDEKVKRHLTRARRAADRNRLERALEIYESILGSVTSYAGEIRDEYEELQDQLRRDYAERLERESRKKKPDHEAAFHWAETLRSHALLWEEEDRQLWRSAAQGYHTARITAFEGSGRWPEAVDEWQKLEEAVGATVEIVEGLHRARRQATLEKMDATLHRLEYEEARSVLEDAIGLGVREDGELASRRSIIEAMAQADLLFRDGHYEDMVECLADCEEEYGVEALVRKREQLTGEAVRSLVHEAEKKPKNVSGDELVEMISRYVRARSLDPGDKRAERNIERAQTELPGVLSQLFAEALAFTSIGRPLEAALHDVRSKASRLRAFMTVTSYTEEPEEWDMKLRGVLNRLQASINDLEQVRGYLERAPIDGEVWQTAVRTGDLRPLEGALRAAREIDADLPEIREYDKRLQEAADGRRRTMEFVVELRKSFEEDNFDGVISTCQSLRAANDLASYLRLLTGETRLYDAYLGQEIIGPVHHEETARRKQANLASWNEWAKKAEELCGRLDDLRESVDRDQQPLSEVIEGLEHCLKAHGDAERHFEKRAEEILSWKAHDLASWAEEAAENLSKVGEQLGHDLEKAQRDRATVQQELQPEIGNAIKDRRWSRAEELLRQAEDLDPHDKLTQHLRSALEQATATEPPKEKLKKKLGRLIRRL